MYFAFRLARDADALGLTRSAPAFRVSRQSMPCREAVVSPARLGCILTATTPMRPYDVRPEEMPPSLETLSSLTINLDSIVRIATKQGQTKTAVVFADGFHLWLTHEGIERLMTALKSA